MTWLIGLGYLAGFTVTGWIWITMAVYLMRAFGREVSDRLLSIKVELRPFIPVLAAFDLLMNLMNTDSLYADTMSVISCAIAFWVFATDEDDDDRWKRRRDRLTGKVKNLGHKLAVAPAEG